jgi:hypothetical protein
VGTKQNGALLPSGWLGETELSADEAPFGLLEQMVDNAGSGELVAADGDLEVHVYLLEGRIAWATSSAAPNAFSRFLVEQCGVARDTLREVIAECQQSRGRLGETLISWGIVGESEVRAALRAQIVGAISTLVAMRGGPRALFLQRRLEYARDLTFELDEVWSSDGNDPTDSALDWDAAAIAEAVPDATWVVVARDGEVVSTHTASSDVQPAASLASELSRCLATTESHSLALRSAYGLLLAHALPDAGGAAICALPTSAKLGLAIAQIASVLGAPPLLADDSRPAALSCKQDTTLTRSLAPLETALASTDELLAAAVVASDQRHAAVFRESRDLGRVLRAAACLGGLLSRSFAEHVPAPVGLVSYDRIALHLDSGQLACFAELAASEPPMCLWLAMSRSAPSGLGWALLTTLVRQMGDCVAT